MADLSIQTDSTKNIPVIKVIGRVDSDSAPHLDEALTKLLQDHNKPVLKLQDVESMSSAGLQAIVKSYQPEKNRWRCAPCVGARAD